MKRGTEALPVAVNFLKQARATGHTQLNKTFFFGDVKVRVVLNPFTGDRVFVESTECQGPRLSGLVDTFKSPAVYRARINAQVDSEYRGVLDSDSTPYVAKLFRGVQPLNQGEGLISSVSGSVVPPNTQGLDGDIFTTENESEVWRKENGSWVKLETQNRSDAPLLTTNLPVAGTTYSEENKEFGVQSSLWKETFERFLPSKFTGHMRRVMQVTFATPAWEGFAVNSKGVISTPVDYRFGDSWGCLIHNGSLHFVRITGTAVYRVPATYCVNKVSRKPGEVVDAVTLNSVDLAAQVKLYDIPAGLGESWGPETGWAFSYDTLEAAVVLHSKDYVGAEKFVFTRLLTVKFAVDSATKDLYVTELEIGKKKALFAPVGMTGKYDSDRSLLNIVQDLGPDFGGIQNITFDFGRQYVGQTGPTVSDAPVHIFYREGAEKQLTTYTYKEIEEQTDTVSLAPLGVGIQATGDVVSDYTDRLNQSFVGSKSSAPVSVYGFSVGGMAPSGKGDRTDDYYEWSYKVSVPSNKLSTIAEHAIWSCDLRANYVDPPPPHSVIYAHIGGTLSGSYQPWIIGRSHVIKSGGGTSVFNSVVFPVNDREAVAVYEEKTTAPETSSKDTEPWSYIEMRSDRLYGAYNGNSDGYSDAVISAYLGDAGVCGILTVENYQNTVHTASPVGFIWNLAPLAGSLTVSPSEVRWDNLIGPSACGNFARTVTTSAMTEPRPANTSESVSTDGSTVTAVRVVGAAGVVDLGLGGSPSTIMWDIKRVDSTLVFWYSQAAFDPSNYATHKSEVNGAAVVKIGNEEYDVRHQLFGWIGVA